MERGLDLTVGRAGWEKCTWEGLVWEREGRNYISIKTSFKNRKGAGGQWRLISMSVI